MRTNPYHAPGAEASNRPTRVWHNVQGLLTLQERESVNSNNRAVCHDILEFSARVLDTGLSSYPITRFPFASS